MYSAQDYYPFGSPMEGRTSTGDYRFGYNGMEAEDELYGESNAYDFGARMYDSRLGRFLSIDPDFFKYPWNSTYAYAINSPIKFVDKGGEGPDVIKNESSAQIKLTGSSEIRIITRKDGSRTETFVGKVRGSIVLNPGDVYYEVDAPVTFGTGENTQTFVGGIGKIVRDNGDVEYVMINDVDFIDVEDDQTFVLDGKEIVNDENKEIGRNDKNGKRAKVLNTSVVSTEEVDEVDEYEAGKEWVATPNKGEIKTNDAVSSVTLTDELNDSGAATGNIKVETSGFGSTTSLWNRLSTQTFRIIGREKIIVNDTLLMVNDKLSIVNGQFFISIDF
jgi:RHS repeat-associated protein